MNATEAVHAFCIACNTSTSGGIFCEVVSFDSSVESHTSPATGLIVPGGFIQGVNNCVRIDLPYRIGRAALDSWIAHEVKRQIVEDDDVPAAKDEGIHSMICSNSRTCRARET